MLLLLLELLLFVGVFAVGFVVCWCCCCVVGE